MKLIIVNGKFYLNEGYKVTEFDSSLEAWRYILLLKEFKPHATIIPKTLYPVKSLNPIPQLRAKTVTARLLQN